MNLETFRNSPINVNLLKVEEKDLPRLFQIKSPQIFENSSNDFKFDGLFSIKFGDVSSEIRNRTFGYIDLGITIIHPFVYHILTKLKSFYKQIAEGKVNAIYNSKTKEFEKSNSPESNTGFNFFISHIDKLSFERNESDQRNFYIDLYKKAVKENSITMKYLLVMPAGLRDYFIDQHGKPQEDEINSLYRKIISQSSILDPNTVKKNPDIYDNIAIGLQNTSLELFEYIKSLLEGKHKLILGKWLTRKIFNSTRNVLSSPIERSNNINDTNRLRYNECVVGIHQFSRALIPKSLYEIKNKYIKDIFIENSTMAFLTNIKTLKREEVLNTHIQKDYDLWTSSEGLHKVVAMLGNLDLRNEPVYLNKGKHYLGLVYRDDKYFKFLQDIDDVPEGFDKSKVTPITLSEFMYISIYSLNGKYPGFITRYPITGFGSIYPSFIKLITTINSYQLEELDNEWNPTGNIASSFPDKKSDYFNTTSVHSSHLKNLGGDFDGDTVSLTAILSDDSVQEINDYLNKKEYYFNDTNEFVFSNSTDTLDAILNYMT